MTTRNAFATMILALILLISACSKSSPATPGSSSGESVPQSGSSSAAAATKSIDEERITADVPHYSGLNKMLEGTYTNQNGYSHPIQLSIQEITNLEILNRATGADQEEVFTCKAGFSTYYWVGTTEFTIGYRFRDGEYSLSQLDFQSIDASPSRPLDFSDENIAVLFESDKFRYRPDPEQKEVKVTPVNQETLESICIVEFLPGDNDHDDSYEVYTVELRLVNGDVLQGTAAFRYWPAISTNWEMLAKMQGPDIWDSILAKDDFVKVG